VHLGEESVAGHVGVNKFIKSYGREIQRGARWGPGGNCRRTASLLQVLSSVNSHQKMSVEGHGWFPGKVKGGH
jgi:hypothetical protein